MMDPNYMRKLRAAVRDLEWVARQADIDDEARTLLREACAKVELAATPAPRIQIAGEDYNL